MHEDVAAQNEQAQTTLERAIALSQGRFSLILVRCNYAHLRKQVLEKLRKRCSIKIREIVLPQLAKTLYTTIKTELGTSQPAALMILGLESVTALDDLLTSSNQVRDEFSKEFSFPLVLWINDEVLQKLVKLAPDFYSWAGVPIRIAIATDELIQFLQREADSLFTKVLDVGADQFVDNATLNLGIGTSKRFEIELALKELQSLPLSGAKGRGYQLSELEASQQFILGRDAYAKNQMERSRQLYEQSLAFWQQDTLQSKDQSPESKATLSTRLERQACLMFHLGLWWRKYAVLHRGSYDIACRRAQDYERQAVEVLQQANRPKLMANINS